MSEGAKERIATVEAELSRVAELRIKLEKSLEHSDTDRAELRREVRVLDSRIGRLHDELAYAHRRQADLHAELDAAFRTRMQLEATISGDPPPSSPEPPAPPTRGEAPASNEDLKDEPPPPTRLKAAPGPVAIEVRDLRKVFQLPAHEMETLKERVLHPFRSRAHHEIRALNGVSFDVEEGEFLGIVGPNGSGKSTLLKLLASVYAADGGSVRVAGRVAPFIELGVGLNPELAAFDNVVVSGVMMGLDPQVVRELYSEIIEFAGLEAFTKVKLKNYSSGMRVRLAFSVMTKVDADILLIDEVLAVGDVDFRAKCLHRLRTLRDEGKTIIFVTHAMDTMKAHCDRALLLRDGLITVEGTTEEVSEAYLSTAEPSPSEKQPLKAAGQ